MKGPSHLLNVNNVDLERILIEKRKKKPFVPTVQLISYR